MQRADRWDILGVTYEYIEGRRMQDITERYQMLDICRSRL